MNELEKDFEKSLVTKEWRITYCGNPVGEAFREFGKALLALNTLKSKVADVENMAVLANDLSLFCVELYEYKHSNN